MKFIPLASLAENTGYATHFFNETDLDDNKIQEIIKTPGVKNVIVYAEKKITITQAQLNELKTRRINLYLIFSPPQIVDQAINATSPIAFFINYSFSRNDRVGFKLEKLRETGGNIDNYLNWYLSFLFGQTDVDAVDQSNNPDYYQALGKKFVSGKLTDFKTKYDNLLKKIDLLSFRDKFNCKIWETIHAKIKNHHHFLGETISSSANLFDLARCREAFFEYRALLNHTVYLRCLAAKETNSTVALYETLEKKLEQNFCQLTDPLLNKTGQNYPQSALLFSSGMAAAKTILHFLLAADDRENAGPKVIIGNSVYYEINNIVKYFKPRVKRVNETDTKEILSVVATGEYRALFLDPISNAARKGDSDAHDIPVADFKSLLRALLLLKYDRPFYFVIDTSLFGPTFQLNNYLNNIDLPHNFRIILFSSLQKLHQDGQELTSGGVVTIISPDAKIARRVLSLIRQSRSLLGTVPNLLSYLALDCLPINKEEIVPRAARTLKNAQTLAEHISGQINPKTTEVVHPGLAAHPDHQVWLENGKQGIPFVFIRLASGVAQKMFLQILTKKLANVGLPLLKRDSYGFANLSYSTFSDLIICLTLPPFNDFEMVVLMGVVGEALQTFNKNVAILEAQYFGQELNGEGFEIGGINTDETIEKLTELNGLPIEEIERLAQSFGLIPRHNKLIDSLIAANALIKESGLPHAGWAAKLFALMNACDEGETEVACDELRWRLTSKQLDKTEKSIFNDGLAATKCYQFTNLDTGQVINFTGLAPYYIARYGFWGELQPAEVRSFFVPKHLTLAAPEKPKIPNNSLLITSLSS